MQFQSQQLALPAHTFGRELQLKHVYGVQIIASVDNTTPYLDGLLSFAMGGLGMLHYIQLVGFVCTLSLVGTILKQIYRGIENHIMQILLSITINTNYFLTFL